MTRYTTYQKWKPLIDEFRESHCGSVLSFCQMKQISYNSFRSVLRSEKFGLIKPPPGASPQPHLNRSARSDQHITFYKVVIRKD